MKSELKKQIIQSIKSFMNKNQVPGLAFGLVNDNEPVLVQGFGLANVEHQVPVTPETVFSIASITKVFTATAVFQLIEQGKINLTDTLGKHLPHLPKAWHPIQIHHILCHQSGIKSYTEVEDYWKSTRHCPLQLRPHQPTLRVAPSDYGDVFRKKRLAGFVLSLSKVWALVIRISSANFKFQLKCICTPHLVTLSPCHL